MHTMRFTATLVLSLTGLALTGCSAPPPGEDGSPSLPPGKLVIGYYPSWVSEGEGAYPVSKIPAHLLTHVNFAFADVSAETGTVVVGFPELDLPSDEGAGGIGNFAALNALKEKVVKPLSELRVACYYGCLLSRPAEIAFDDPEQPMIMERVLEAAGAETVSWSHRLECCGASHAVPLTDAVLRLVNDVLASARDAGADIIACACPLCQANLDMRQEGIRAKLGVAHNLPAVYFTQLLGIACGAAIFVVERRTWIDGRAITRARLVHPGATHRLVARTQPPI